VLDHRVDIGRRDLDNGARDRHAFDTLQLDFGNDLEHGAILEIAALLEIEGLDLRSARGRKLLLLHGFRERLLQNIAEHFLAHLIAELLAHDFDRHFARPEALEAYRPAQTLQSFIDRLLDAFCGNLYFHPALERADRFYRDLHLTTSQKLACRL